MSNPLPGYCYTFQPASPDAVHTWRTSSDEDWPTEVFTLRDGEEWIYQGTRTIDGSRCRVWRMKDTTAYIAQVALG